MISFRFYLISLIAIFLALAVGVVVGSTFVDRAIVDALRDRVDEVSFNLDRRQADNDTLQDQVDALESYIEQSAPFIVERRLLGDDVVVAAERGVGEDAVADAVALIQQAGATAPGILWLESRWALAEDDDLASLAEALDITRREPNSMRDRAWALAVVEQLVQPPDLADPVGGDEGTPLPGTLASLAEAGFVEFEQVGEEDADITGLAGLGSSVVLMVGSEAEATTPGWAVAMAQELVDAGVATVVAESFQDTEGGPGRGAVITGILDAGDLAAAVSTVDHLERRQGQVALVLALDDLSNGLVGNYGVGSTADRQLPEEPQ